MGEEAVDPAEDGELVAAPAGREQDILRPVARQALDDRLRGKQLELAADDADVLVPPEGQVRALPPHARERRSLEDVQQVEDALQLLPRLSKLVMCGCGLTDEQMAALCEAHPEVRFVWTVQIGPHEVRTDATGFSTANPSKYTNPNASDEYNEKVRTTKRLQEGDLEPLRYCTDLVALDLGHNYLTDADLEVIASLTKLEILILADNKITDISALSSLKELQYIELFMNRIEDVSPLAGLTNLIDVNICNIGLTDLSPLYQMTWLERLWYGMNPASTEDEQALAAALPDCACNYTTRDETGEGWREHERYTWMRSFFK